MSYHLWLLSTIVVALTWLLSLSSIASAATFVAQTPFYHSAADVRNHCRQSLPLCYYRADQDENDASSSASPSSSSILKEKKEGSQSQKQQQQQQSFSKSKWKKKRYVMMKDVDDAIVVGDSKRAVKRAREMIRRMTKLYRITGVEEYKPTVQAYNLLIHALAKSRWSDAGYEAERVLQQMMYDGVTPNAISFTSTLDAYAKSSGQTDAPQQAERVLLELLDLPNVHLDISALDAVLNAYAQQSSLEAAERALDILERWETLQQTDNISSNSGNGSSSRRLQPTVHSYATVMNAFAKCGAAERAHSILNRVLLTDEKQNDSNINNIDPDKIMFNVVIHAWATSGNAQAGIRAVELLQEMQDLASQGYDTAPDIVTYNSVLSAWAKSGHVNSGPQAEKILKQLQEQNDDNDDDGVATNVVHPNVVSYNSVLHAWSKSSGAHPGAAERAQAVLDYMVASNNEAIAPDVYSFTSVLDAWAKSKQKDKAVRARTLLDTMLKCCAESPQLSAIPFNTLLNACAFSPTNQREALQIAVQTFKGLPQYTTPDTITYGNLLKCCTNLMPDGKARIDMATHIFDRCRNQGLVGDLVWNEVRKVVPSRDLSAKVGPLLKKNKSVGMMSLQDLPRAWRQNTRDKRKRRAVATRRRKKRDDGSSTASPQLIRPVRNIVEKSYESGRDV